MVHEVGAFMALLE